MQTGDAALAELMRGAAASIYLGSSPAENGVTGWCFVDEEERRSTAVSDDEALAQKLWKTSLNLLGESHEA